MPLKDLTCRVDVEERPNPFEDSKPFVVRHTPQTATELFGLSGSRYREDHLYHQVFKHDAIDDPEISTFLDHTVALGGIGHAHVWYREVDLWLDDTVFQSERDFPMWRELVAPEFEPLLTDLIVSRNPAFTDVGRYINASYVYLS